jgi:hypothetical protein
MRPFPIAVVGLPEQAIQALVMEVVEPPLIPVTRGLHTSEATVNEPADEVVRLLSVCDAGEAAVLTLEEHTGVRHDGRQETGLALSEPEGLEADGALGDDIPEAKKAHAVTP